MLGPGKVGHGKDFETSHGAVWQGKIGYGLEGTKIGLLPYRNPRVIRPGLSVSSEVSDAVDCVLGEQGITECCQVQPFV